MIFFFFLEKQNKQKTENIFILIAVYALHYIKHWDFLMMVKMSNMVNIVCAT